MSLAAQNIAIVAEMTAKPGQEGALCKALEAAVAPSNAEEGNITYRLHQNLDAPGHFVFYEIWKDEAAIDIHVATPHFNALIAAIEPLSAKTVIHKLQAIAG